MSETKFAEEHILLKIGRTAKSPVASRRFVKVASDDHSQCELAGDNEAAAGVSLTEGAEGVGVPIAVAGIVMVDAGGGIGIDDEVIAGTDGKAVARGTTASTLYRVRGRALTQAQNGEQVCLLLTDYTVWGDNAQ